MFRNAKNIHFVGIGGVGMSGIAELLLTLKFKVSGSDIRKNDTVKRLKKLGAKIYIGHKEENVNKKVDVVVMTSAVNFKNPELKKARQLKIPVIQRAEMLAELMRLKQGIAVAGTHGKTTTTSILGSILNEAGIDPTTIVGGKFFNIGTNAQYGKGDYLLCEADESDGSFLHLSPIISIVTNIDNDHLDYYKTEENLQNTFLEFINRVPFYGFAVLNGDDKNIKKLFPKIHKKYYTYGFTKNNEFLPKNIKIHTNGVSFTLERKGKKIGVFHINKFGKHYVLNAVASIVVALELGISVSKIAQGLEKFKGVGRRMEYIGESNDVIIYDDYAHHPTELKATIQAFRMIPAKRRIGIFQPHRYSRTKLLADEFSQSFGGLDELIITDIYPASEKPIKGISSKTIYSKIKNVPKIIYIKNKKEIAKKMIEHVKPGDLVISLGAGDVTKIGRELFNYLKGK